MYKEDNTANVNPNIETICCDEGQDELGNPAFYYTFNNEKKIVCGYYNKTFIKKRIREH